MKSLDKHPGGRPPKFTGSRKIVTVTLPEEILQQLMQINTDRAKAIVKATESYMSKYCLNQKTVEIVEIEKGIGIILVNNNTILKRIPWVKLIEVSPSKYLVTLESGTPVDSLEVALSDLLDSDEPDIVKNFDFLKELQKVIRHLRRDKKVNKAEMLFVQI